MSMARPALVIVGTGMAAARAVQEIVARAPDRFGIRLFGDEPHGTYDRTLLSRVLGHFAEPDDLWLAPLEWYEKHGILVHAGVRAESIDLDKRLVRGAGGKVVEPYDLLVLATGSRAFVPPLDGAGKSGCFVFRNLEDCARIADRAGESEHAVVLGGGLLGLEAAAGLLEHDLAVTVVEAAPHLMPQQLDALGASLLRSKLEARGVEVRTSSTLRRILGDGEVTGVELGDGTTLPADLVVLACGIRPNVEEARHAGLLVERAVVVDDQMRTSDRAVFALGECCQHRGQTFGLVEPIYDQARVLADVLTEANPEAAYSGWRPASVLKVAGIDLLSLGDVQSTDAEVVAHLDPEAGVYKKLLVKDGKLAGAILLGARDESGLLGRLFRQGDPLPAPLVRWLGGWVVGSPEAPSNDPTTQPPNHLTTQQAADLSSLPDDATICNCNGVCKGALVGAIRAGKATVSALGQHTRAGTGCGTCQPILAQLLDQYAAGKPREANKVEVMKRHKDGLDARDDVLALVPGNRWQEMSEDDKQRAKWHGLFFRKATPGHFMLRLRFDAGRANARQLRVIADLCEEYGKGFCDLTTRQQVQLRWFTLADLPDIWRRLDEVGLHSKQTGMDNVRGVCGCPMAGLTPHELLDASPVIAEFTRLLLDNREFTNLPRKFNVTITGCLENCCHVETQDVGLVPAYREIGAQVNGFNVLVGGKQGSGGYRPASPLDVFVRPEDAARLVADVTRIFRDHGPRATRNRARLAFLIEDRGVAWFRAELERRWGRPLHRAGTDPRKPHHVDHIGIQPQKAPQRFAVGLLVPVGRITAPQLRGVADLADRYGTGDIRFSVQQNLVIAGVPEERLAAFTEEPLLAELPFDPSPILRGLVSCTGTDYCHMALIETKGWALEVARELERRTAGKKIAPLSIHWSGCSAGCGLHQVATIGLQGVRSRVNGQVVDAAHVCVKGRAGPDPVVATDLMYDVPCANLVDALLPLVEHLPRK